MFNRICLLLAATMMIVLVGNASAEPVYTYVTDATTYTGHPGTSFQVHVYLKETLSTGDTSVIAADGGLLGAGYDVQLAPSQTNAATITTIAGDSTNFTGGFLLNPNNTATNLSGDNTAPQTATSGPSPTMGLLSIGYITIMPSTVPGTTTQFRLGAYKPGGDGYTDTFNSLYNIDTTSTAPAYIGTAGTLANPIPYDEAFSVVSVAPEPVSSAAILAGFSYLILRPVRRRRQRSLTVR